MLGINIFASGGLAPGYSGAGMNPALCFGAAVAADAAAPGEEQNMQGLWIRFVGPMVASIAHGLLYVTVPPHHHDLYHDHEKAS